jgi:hypothetical protein
MMKIDGVIVPTELLAKLDEEIEDPTERAARVMEYVREQGGVSLPKEQAERALHAPLLALRDRLVKRQADAKAAKAAREARNKEVAERNAQSRGARGNAPAAKPAAPITQDAVAPKSGPALGSKAQG